MSDLPVIEVENLTVNYGKTPALWDINLTIPKGKLVGIIGPNGAGKSTFFKTLLDLVPTVSGKMSFFEQPFRSVRGKIAYVPQRTAVDWDFPITVIDVVLMGRFAKLKGLKWPKAADKKAALAVLKKVGMEAFAKRQISELSGGQQQRIFLARSLLQDADIYLLDEPFNGVDQGSEKAIVDILKKLQAKGKTILVVHHALENIESYFDWTILLNICLIGNGPIKTTFTKENLSRAYGKSTLLFNEAAQLSYDQETGLR